MKKLVSAKSMIERDAIVARLQASGIEPTAPPRDMSRKVTDNTTDLALEGYSVFFDGFDILVDDKDEARAKQLLTEFQNEFKAPATSTEASPHWQRFYYSSIFSIMLPILLNAVALYHLVKALQNREKPKAGFLVFSLFCFFVSASLVVVFLGTLI